MVRNGVVFLLLPTLCSSFSTTTTTSRTFGSSLFSGPTNPTRPNLPQFGASAESLDCDWDVFGAPSSSIRCDRDPEGSMVVEMVRDAANDAGDASSSPSISHVVASTEFPELVWFDIAIQRECRDLCVGVVSWPGVRSHEDDARAQLADDGKNSFYKDGKIRPDYEDYNFIPYRSRPLRRGDRIVLECEVDPSCNGIHVTSFVNGRPAGESLTPASRCPPPLTPWVSFAGASAKFTCNVTTERPPDMVYRPDHPLDGTWKLVENASVRYDENDGGEEEGVPVEIKMIRKLRGPLVVQFRAFYPNPNQSGKPYRDDRWHYYVEWSGGERALEGGGIVCDRLVLKHSVNHNSWGKRVKSTSRSACLEASMSQWASIVLDPDTDTLTILDAGGQPVGKLAEHQQPPPPYYMPKTCAEEQAEREALERRMKERREEARRQPDPLTAAVRANYYDSEDDQSRVNAEWSTAQDDRCGDQDMIRARNERITKAFFDAFGFDEGVVDSYEPDHPGGCIRNLEHHIRLLDQSLQDASGQSLFGWIQTRQFMEGKSPLEFLETARDLHNDSRFAIVSFGTQHPDPVCNYGNEASLFLFETSIKELFQTPVSRFFSTVPEELTEGRRSELLAALERDGHGTVNDAILVSDAGRAFRIPHAVVWTVRDDDGNRIGSAALYDTADVDGDGGRYRSVSDLLDSNRDKP